MCLITLSVAASVEFYPQGGFVRQLEVFHEEISSRVTPCANTWQEDDVSITIGKKLLWLATESYQEQAEKEPNGAPVVTLLITALVLFGALYSLSDSKFDPEAVYRVERGKRCPPERRAPPVIMEDYSSLVLPHPGPCKQKNWQPGHGTIAIVVDDGQQQAWRICP
jgi:hypothetical protein